MPLTLQHQGLFSKVTTVPNISSKPLNSENLLQKKGEKGKEKKNTLKKQRENKDKRVFKRKKQHQQQEQQK